MFDFVRRSRSVSEWYWISFETICWRVWHCRHSNYFLFVLFAHTFSFQRQVALINCGTKWSNFNLQMLFITNAFDSNLGIFGLSLTTCGRWKIAKLNYVPTLFIGSTIYCGDTIIRSLHAVAWLSSWWHFYWWWDALQKLDP